MRTLLIAAAALAVIAGGSADAQVMAGGGGGGQYRVQGYPVQQPIVGQPGPGWGGGYIGGQWSAGARAPGGWAAYRRPQRGWRMPGYWRSPDYRIQNYAAFGLQAPPQGYGWSRYYDDAVLVDYDGRVYDSVGGLDWRRADQPYSTGYGYPSQGYWNSPNGGGRGGDGYAYAQGGQGGQGGQSYGYDSGYRGDFGGSYGGGGATATATFDFGGGRGPETTTTTTTTTTEEWASEPVVTYVPVRERVIYRQGPARVIYKQGPTRVVPGPTRVIYKQAPPQVVYRTVVKKVPAYRAPAKKWRPAPKPTPRCADECECGVVCGS